MAAGANARAGRTHPASLAPRGELSPLDGAQAMTGIPTWDRMLLERHPRLQLIEGGRWERALAAASLVHFADGAQLSGNGSGCGGHFTIVLMGALRVRASARDGRTLGAYRVSAGDLCAVSIVSLYHAPTPIDVVTEGNTTLLRIPDRHFPALLEEPSFRDFVMASLSANVVSLLQRVGETNFENLRERILRRVEEALRCGDALIPLSHQELADELGSTREAVSRVLKELEKQGFLKLGRRAIIPVPRA